MDRLVWATKYSRAVIVVMFSYENQKLLGFITVRQNIFLSGFQSSIVVFDMLPPEIQFL